MPIQFSDHDDGARFLLRCFLLSMGVLFLWFLVCVLFGHQTYRLVHKPAFGISHAHFTLANYFLMGLFKLAAFLFFLVPWIALKTTKAK